MNIRTCTRVCLGATWFTVAAWSVWALSAYSYHPVESGSGATLWPAQTQLPLNTTGCTALIFVHPQCPCTRASITEAVRLSDQWGEDVRWTAVVVEPATTPPDWSEATNVRRLHSAPEWTIHTDVDGIEADRFGAVCSGEMFLYGPDGKLQFRGGITNGRGHEGLNVGVLAMRDWLTTGQSPLASCNVYGCRLISRKAPLP